MPIDLRYAIRLLFKRPLLTMGVVVTIGLAVAATTTVFSVVNGVLLKPLEYEAPGQLVSVWEHNRVRERDRNPVSPANFMAWRDEGVFRDLAAVVAASGTVTGDGEPERVGVVTASASFFPLLGVRAEAGRVYAAEEDVPGAPRVAVLGHGFWQRRYGGDPDIIGRAITLNDRPVNVVGVLPPGFSFEFGATFAFTGSADVWVAHQFGEEERSFGGRYLQVIGRLRPDVPLPQARQRMTDLASRLERAYPDRQAGWGVNVIGLDEQVVGDASRALYVVFGAVGFVLLIAITNVANLLLARTSERQQEVAVRAALGAGRRRIVAQMFVESLVLAVAGGVLGTVLAVWTVGLVRSISPDIPRLENVAVDGTVLAFAAGATVLAGLLFGLAPALQVVRSDLAAWLRSKSIGAGRTEVRHVRSGLVVAEIALSLVLLIGAGLMIRSLVRMLDVGVGFDVDRLLTAEIQLPSARYPGASDRARFFNELVARVDASPGVNAASAITWLPLAGAGTGTSFWANDRPIPEAGRLPVARIRWVHRDYHRTMGIEPSAGRLFNETDRPDSPLRVLISEFMANELWPGTDPIGRTISMPWGDTLVAEIIGVVRDIRHDGPSVEPASTIYWNMEQHQGFNFMSVVVRTDGQPLAFLPTLRAAVRDLDPLLPIYNVRTMDGLLDDALIRARFTALVLASFAFVALVLAVVGIYGVMAYVTGQRAQEFGIRMAIGADRGEVLRLVLGQGARLVGLAIALGLAAALGASRLLGSLVFEVGTGDPLTFVVMSAVLGGTALLACWLPARRAASTDPVDSMRRE